MKSMSKNMARGRNECMQRTGIVSEIFFYLDDLLPS